MSEANIERILSDISELRKYIFTNVDKLQSTVEQSELSTKGSLNSLEFRLEAILQANLDTFWLLMCSILVFLMQAVSLTISTSFEFLLLIRNSGLKTVSPSTFLVSPLIITNLQGFSAA